MRDIRRIWPTTTLWAVAAAALMVFCADRAAAGAQPPHFELQCWSVSVRDSRETRKAYTADQGSRVIFFNETVFFRRPPAIGKLEFADACLTVGQGTDFSSQPRERKLCESIKFLQQRNAFSPDDLDQLEQFTYSRDAELTDYNALSLKSAFACFYR